MPPTKTNSACKRVKRSRKDSLLTLINENDDDDANDQMIVEYPSISNTTTDQLSLLLSEPTDRLLSILANQSSSPSVNRSPSPSPSFNRSTLSSNNDSSSPSVNRTTSESVNDSSPSVNRSISESVNDSSVSVNRSTLSSNNRSSSPSVNRSSSPSVNRSSSPSVNRSTLSSNIGSSSPSVNRSISQPKNGSSASVNRSISQPKNDSSASVNRSISQPKNGSSASVNRSKSQSKKDSSPSVDRSTSSSKNRSSLLSVNHFTSSSNNRSSSPSVNRSSVSHLTTDQPSSSKSATNPLSSSADTSSNSDTVEPTANNNGDEDLHDDFIRKESLVWQYATRNIDNQTAKCLKCNAIIKTTNWSTTGLRKHLTQVHKITTMTPVISLKKSTISQELRNELHDLIVKAVIEDSRSFNDFRRPGMIRFLNKAVPGYVPPHRITISRRLKEFNGIYKERLQQQMLEVNKISITCDFWSDRSLKSYLCITGHHVTYDFGYESTILSFDAFYDRHHGVRIAKIIKEKLNNLNLFNKLLCITTDGAANMRTMCDNLNDINFDWIWCVAHRYHLTINNALGFWSEKKKKTKKIDNINNNNNNINNNHSDDHDDVTEIDDFINNEDDQSFWDDATKDRINEQQHLLDFDKIKEKDFMNLTDDDYDEILNIEEIIYGVVGEQSNVEQMQHDVADGSSNIDDTKVTVDEETFIDYMTNNNLIRDDWDLNLNISNDVFVNDINKKIVYTVINKCRALVTILKQSTILFGYFNQLRLEFSIKRGLPSDCVTRWNSTYFLLDAFINAKMLIIKIFGDKNLYDVRRPLIERLISIELHHEDWQLLIDLHTVLKPFCLATKLMSKRLYPTAGLCYYTVKILFNYLTKDNQNDSTQIKSLKVMLLSQFEYYFLSEKEQLNLLKKYAFFDPLGYSVLAEDDIRNVEQEIKQIIRNEKIHQDEPATTSSSNSFPSTSSSLSTGATARTTTQSTSKYPSTMDQFLLACGEAPVIDHPTIKNRRLTIEEELTIYKQYIIGFYHEHRTRAYALVFWKKYHTALPILAQLARAYLSTPGTSISSESAFSISAYVARKERARLSAENLSYTMFMKDKVASEH